MHRLRSLKRWYILLGALLTLVAASHALQDRVETGHEHSDHGGLVTCVVTLALVGATILQLRTPRTTAAPPEQRRCWAVAAVTVIPIAATPRVSPAWLGRFLR